MAVLAGGVRSPLAGIMRAGVRYARVWADMITRKQGLPFEFECRLLGFRRVVLHEIICHFVKDNSCRWKRGSFSEYIHLWLKLSMIHVVSTGFRKCDLEEEFASWTL